MPFIGSVSHRHNRNDSNWLKSWQTVGLADWQTDRQTKWWTDRWSWTDGWTAAHSIQSEQFNGINENNSNNQLGQSQTYPISTHSFSSLQCSFCTHSLSLSFSLPVFPSTLSTLPLVLVWTKSWQLVLLFSFSLPLSISLSFVSFSFSFTFYHTFLPCNT